MFGVFLAPSAQAQFWVTPDVCAVEKEQLASEPLSETTRSDIAKDVAQIANGVGRFWEITAPNGQVSHLWGTLHSNDPLMLDLPQALVDVLKSAKSVAVEIDFIAPSRRAVDMRFEFRDIWRPAISNATFAKIGLSDQVNDWIASRMHGLGMGRGSVDYIVPAAIAEFLLADPCNDFANVVFPNQDSLIQLMGQIHGAESLSLETPKAFFNRLKTDDDLTRSVLAVLGSNLDPTKIAPGRKAGFALYHQGRIGELMALDRHHLRHFFGPDKGQKHSDAVNGYLLDEGNHLFLKSAEAALQTGGLVIAVGCFHLPGEQGLVALLRDAGYSVTRLPVAGEVPL